jgi:hypothetical protein
MMLQSAASSSVLQAKRPNNKVRFELPIMLAILLLASVFYLRDINGVSFWEDESWMAIAIDGDLPHVWTFATERGVHPPLYFYLGWVYTRFTGDSEIALRWLAGLCALVGIAFIYRLGADWFGQRAGVFAALLTAGSLFLIYFGRLARHYTLFFALAVALVWVYERWLRSATQTPIPNPSPVNRGREKHRDVRTFAPPLRWRGGGWGVGLIALILLQAALVYTHYFGVWMAGVIGLHGLIYLRGRDRLWLIGGLVVSGVLFVPWIPSLLAQMNQEGSLGYGTRVAEHALRAYLDRVFNGDYILGIVLALAGAFAIWRWRKTRAGALLALWLVLPLGLSLLLNTRFVWFVERNMIFTLGAAYILFGAGLGWVMEVGLTQFSKRAGTETRPYKFGHLRESWVYRIGRVIAPIAALVFVALGILRYSDFWPYETPHWRDIARAISWNSRPDDVFMVAAEPYSMSYYLHRFMGERVTIIDVDEWVVHTDSPRRVWLTDARSAVTQEAIDALPPDMVQTRRYVLGVLVTEFYQRAPDEGLTTFDDQIVLGADLQTIEAAPGQTLTLDLWWRALRQPDTDYSVGIYLVDDEGRTIAQQDGGFDRGQVPAVALPQDRWTPDMRALTVPLDLPPGEYALLVAVYDWRDGSRLTPENGREDRAYELTTVQIQP